jgi:hypothetical protein
MAAPMHARANSEAVLLPTWRAQILPMATVWVTLLATNALLVKNGMAQEPERLEFTRIVAHWANYADDDYLSFIADAEPDLAQLGFYGGHYWSLAHTPQYSGYPAHFPLQGLQENRQWFAEKNASLHQKNVKVIGHFNVEFLVGDPDGPEGPRGFFKFYRDLWDEEKLGPRPVIDPLDLLEKDAAGQPRVSDKYSIGGMKEYWACLRNPHWQQVMKAWVKQGVDAGVDGFIANYFYRHDCLCKHCQKDFRGYLSDRFSALQLKERFAINQLEQHLFDEIVCWHAPEDSTPLRREMLRWSQISNKAVFDEVFVNFGRSLKPDLIVAQWNHLGNFHQISGDERCMLPAEVWGRSEDYLWYSTGSAANFTDLANNDFGDATLQARYIRGAFDDKPFTLGKYEITRIRVAIAELAANGGAPMGFYTRFTDPTARQTIVRYYQFLKRYDSLYRANRSHAEVLLLFPRRAVQQGDVAAIDTFRRLGKRLLDRHILFDVLADDLFPVDLPPKSDARRRYAAVLSTTTTEFPPSIESRLSQFDAPAAVRISASKPNGNDKELTLHFVNYNRDEPPKRNRKPNPGRGAADEKPIATETVRVHFSLPVNAQVTRVAIISPEQPEPMDAEFKVANGILSFDVQSFLVYAVARVYLAESPIPSTK